MEKKRLLIISGFSGAGKGTVIKKMLDMCSDLWLSILETTRAKRNELDRYIFVTEDAFKKGISAGRYIEFNRYGENYYGSPKCPIIKCLENNQTPVLEIDYNGQRQAKKDIIINKLAEIRTVFIVAPAGTLHQRLTGRGDSRAEIRKRLATALTETEAISEYDYILENRSVDETALKLLKIVHGEEVESDKFSAEEFRNDLEQILDRERNEGMLVQNVRRSTAAEYVQYMLNDKN